MNGLSKINLKVEINIKSNLTVRFMRIRIIKVRQVILMILGSDLTEVSRIHFIDVTFYEK